MNNQTHLLSFLNSQTVKKIKLAVNKNDGNTSVIFKTIESATANAPITKQINGTFLNLKIIAIKTANKTIEIAIINPERLLLKSLSYQGEIYFSILKRQKNLFNINLTVGKRLKEKSA